MILLLLALLLSGCKVYHDEPKLRSIRVELTECREQVYQCEMRSPEERLRRGESIYPLTGTPSAAEIWP